jgi:gamma-glutamylcyclotransferase (GGCT)/AIG2-like uncharacterized protein YtfP
VDELLAFYGTLLSGLPPRPRRPDLTPHVRLVCDCLIPGRLFDLGPCPALLPGEAVVLGELWRTASDDALRVLDAWEAYHPSNEEASDYVRRKIRLVDPDVSAWVYVWNRSSAGLPRITDGDWRARAGAAAPTPVP